MVKKKDKIGFWFAVCSAAILILDQLTKFLAASKLTASLPIIKNVFHLTLTTNTGAGFGILKNFNSALIWVSIFVIGMILYYYDQIKGNRTAVAVGLILGGIVGNLIDRIRLGYVVDFLDFRVWPIFNIADSAITIGIFLIIIYYWKK